MRIIHLVSYLILLIAFIFLGVIGYWSFYPYNLLEFGEGNGKILTPVVEKGGYVQMYQNNCKLTDQPATLDRQYIDGIIYQVPTYVAKRDVGCFENVEIIHLPEALPEGEYFIRTTITYQPNPIRKVSYTVVSEQFKIIE